MYKSHNMICSLIVLTCTNFIRPGLLVYDNISAFVYATNETHNIL